MTTLLEYVLSQPDYCGAPTSIRGNGESHWPCPVCGHDSFRTYPENPQYKHRAKCWGCEFRGDVIDMLREFHPDETYGDLLDRKRQLERAFEIEHGHRPKQ